MCYFLVVFSRKREKRSRQKNQKNKTVFVLSWLFKEYLCEFLSFFLKTKQNSVLGLNISWRRLQISMEMIEEIIHLFFFFFTARALWMDLGISLSSFFHSELKCFNKMCHFISSNRLFYMLVLKSFHCNKVKFSKNQATFACQIKCLILSKLWIWIILFNFVGFF